MQLDMKAQELCGCRLVDLEQDTMYTLPYPDVLLKTTSIVRSFHLFPFHLFALGREETQVQPLPFPA